MEIFRGQRKPIFQGLSLALAVPNYAGAERLFAAQAVGGELQTPVPKHGDTNNAAYCDISPRQTIATRGDIYDVAFSRYISARFGMVAGRFGVSWMVYVGP